MVGIIRSLTRCLGDHEAIRVIHGYVRSLLDDVSMNARIERISSEVKVERAWLCVWLYVKDVVRGCECIDVLFRVSE